MKRILEFLSTMADTPQNTKEEKRQHAFLIYIGILMSFGGLLWGTIVMSSGLFYQSFIPFAYVIITFGNYVLIYYTKDFNTGQAVQLGISLLLPFMLQLALGGFVASGAMVLWSVITIFAAFTYKQNNTIIRWLFVFIGLIILSALLDATASSKMEQIPQEISILFFAINIIVVSTVIFTLFYYFVGSEKRFRISLEENLIYVQNAQESLVESEKMASLGRLVAGVAHEINTPVGVSITAASHLEKSTKDFLKLYREKKVKENDFNSFVEVATNSSRMILQNLERAGELITSFKSLSVDQSLGDLREINVKEYINSIILSLGTKLQKSSYTIEVKCPDDLVIDIVAGSLAQIVTNLVENAYIHAFKEREKGHILLEIKEEDDTIVLLYADNGRGLTEEEKENFFEPFYTTKRDEGGSGLGTHIMYNLVTQSLNGQIAFVNKLEDGLALKITIPMMGKKDV